MKRQFNLEGYTMNTIIDEYGDVEINITGKDVKLIYLKTSNNITLRGYGKINGKTLKQHNIYNEWGSCGNARLSKEESNLLLSIDIALPYYIK